MSMLRMQNGTTKSTGACSREIFLAALEHADPAARAAFLEEACGGDATLRDEVVAFLEDEETLGGFLQEPALAGAREVASAGTRGVDDQTSERIGPYKLLQKIGEGGCGRVYMAEQQEPVRRRVALKVIKLGMDTRSVIARFESERQALAMMDHTSIARVLDAGATDTGRPYFVMELVRGIPITEYCDKENLSARERLAIFIQVSNAIQHAHQKGIIHRDIKPSNILVTLHDGVPVPKIIDFGIAKATEQRLTDKTLFTEYQAFIGTPAYMSPEQAEMSGLDIDTRSDIYALGVLLYELLVGKTPFDAQMLRESGLDECRRTIRESEPATPSTRLATMLNADQSEIARHRRMDSPELVHLLRGDLDWIVMKCLEKDRRRRYETVHDLVLDIQRHLDGQAVLARPPSTLYRLQKLVRRHRGVFAAAACLSATLVAGAAVSTWQMLRAREAERIAYVAEQNQSKLLAQAEEGWHRALTSERAARVNTYVADINLTQHALDEGNFGRAVQLIERHRPDADDGPDLRGFEWRYLAGLCRGDRHISFPNQNGAVHALAVSPDGEMLAAGTPEHVNIWDIRSQALVTTLPISGEGVAFLPDGETLVTSGRRSIHAWDLRTFTEHARLPQEEDSVMLSPDGSLMATRRGDGIQIIDAATLSPQTLLVGAYPPVAFSPGNEWIVTTTRGGLTIWDTRTGDALRELEDSAGLMGPYVIGGRQIIFSSDGKQVIAPRNRSSDQGVFFLGIWDVATGKQLEPMPSNPDVVYHTGVISCLALSPDGRTLATGSWDHSVSLWDLETRRHLNTLRGQSHEVWSVAFSQDGKSVIAGGKDGSLNTWPMETVADGDVIQGHWRPMAISANGKQMAALGRDARVGFFDLGTRQMTHSIELSSLTTQHWFGRAVAISADLRKLAHGGEDGRVSIWDTQSREITTLNTGQERAGLVELSPEGRYLIVGNRGKPLTVWDLQRGAGEGPGPVVTIAAERAFFSGDGTVMIVVCGRRNGGGVEVWDTSDFQMRRRIDMTIRPGGNLAVSPDGRILATTNDRNDFDNSVRLRDTGSGDLIGECAGHKQSVWSIAFSPDGRTLVSSSDDSTLKFWNIETQQEMLSIRRVGNTLTDLRFSPDGRWLVAAASPFSTDGDVRLLRAPGFEEIDRWLQGKARISTDERTPLVIEPKPLAPPSRNL
ncbi:MAG: serine/threonine-protein kinase [Verrucomicrobiales bacterium]